MRNLPASIRTDAMLGLVALIALGVWQDNNAPTVRTWETTMRVSDWEKMESGDGYFADYHVPIITAETIQRGTVTAYRCAPETADAYAHCSEIGLAFGFGPKFWQDEHLSIPLVADLPLIFDMVARTPILRVTVIMP